MKKKLKFKIKKETKNTYQYVELTETDRSPVMRTIYLAKWFAKQKPKEVTVTVEF